MAWRPPPEQAPWYAATWREHADEASGAVTGAAARPLLLASGLDPGILRQVWELCDSGSKGALSPPEFAAALRWIALCQWDPNIQRNTLTWEVFNSFAHDERVPLPNLGSEAVGPSGDAKEETNDSDSGFGDFEEHVAPNASDEDAAGDPFGELIGDVSNEDLPALGAASRARDDHQEENPGSNNNDGGADDAMNASGDEDDSDFGDFEEPDAGAKPPETSQHSGEQETEEQSDIALQSPSEGEGLNTSSAPRLLEDMRRLVRECSAEDPISQITALSLFTDTIDQSLRDLEWMEPQLGVGRDGQSTTGNAQATSSSESDRRRNHGVSLCRRWVAVLTEALTLLDRLPRSDDTRGSIRSEVQRASSVADRWEVLLAIVQSRATSNDDQPSDAPVPAAPAAQEPDKNRAEEEDEEWADFEQAESMEHDAGPAFDEREQMADRGEDEDEDEERRGSASDDFARASRDTGRSNGEDMAPTPSLSTVAAIPSGPVAVSHRSSATPAPSSSSAAPGAPASTQAREDPVEAEAKRILRTAVPEGRLAEAAWLRAFLRLRRKAAAVVDAEAESAAAAASRDRLPSVDNLLEWAGGRARSPTAIATWRATLVERARAAGAQRPSDDPFLRRFDSILRAGPRGVSDVDARVREWARKDLRRASWAQSLLHRCASLGLSLAPFPDASNAPEDPFSAGVGDSGSLGASDAWAPARHALHAWSRVVEAVQEAVEPWTAPWWCPKDDPPEMLQFLRDAASARGAVQASAVEHYGPLREAFGAVCMAVGVARDCVASAVESGLWAEAGRSSSELKQPAKALQAQWRALVEKARVVGQDLCDGWATVSDLVSDDRVAQVREGARWLATLGEQELDPLKALRTGDAPRDMFGKPSRNDPVSLWLLWARANPEEAAASGDEIQLMHGPPSLALCADELCHLTLQPLPLEALKQAPSVVRGLSTPVAFWTGQRFLTPGLNLWLHRVAGTSEGDQEPSLLPEHSWPLP